MEIIDHWVTGVSRLKSPNCDERPVEIEISLIVIHCISLPPGQFGGKFINQLFTNLLNPSVHPYFGEIYELKVSSHILIRRNGEIVQFVPFNKRAWHAGPSQFGGRVRCNDFSIGIELEGTEQMAYTNDQYAKLAVLIKTLIEFYPDLSVENITGHSHIAPGRKLDPGVFFDWKRLQEIICGCEKTD